MRYLIILLIVLLFGSCSNPTTQTNEVINYYPLAVGNQWQYKRIYYDSVGIETKESLPETTIIIGDTIISSEHWFYEDALGHFLGYRNSQYGVLARLVSPNTDGVTKMKYKFPVRIGDTFKYPVVTYSGNQAWLADTLLFCTIITVDTVVRVPAGAYHCIQYRISDINNSSWWSNVYLAYGYGIIQTDYYGPYGSTDKIYKYVSRQLQKVVLK